ncbi:MAG: tRNA (adenosine(37)-N6)-threonylcarbamoyltransferase complex dimerization subunit type 1 TsaB [Steroidobacteraceae bacterium]
MKLLAIDTASAQCSVALLLGEELIVREVATSRDHARLILPMIDAVLAEAGVSLRQLQGIAFGRGPGSFTGVRVAASVTQGLALGAGLPVLPVSDLRALAAQALFRMGPPGEYLSGHVLACMDARMGEVYWAAYGSGNGALAADATPERVSAPDQLMADFPGPCIAGAGLGLAAWPRIADSLKLTDYCFSDAEPHAREVAGLAAQDLAAGAQWLDGSQALPVYVRDQVAVAKIPI